MKELSVKAKCPVFALAQLKRTEGIPKLIDLRESGSLEQDADTVLFPFRPSYSTDNSSGFEQGNTNFNLPKCRSAGPDYFTGYLDLLTYRVYNQQVHTLTDYQLMTGRT